MIAVSDALECSSDFQRNKTGRKKAVGGAKGIETETETQTQSMKRLPWVSGPVSLSSSSSLVCASRWTEDQGQTTKIRDRGNKKWQTWPWVGSLSMYIHIYMCIFTLPSVWPLCKYGCSSHCLEPLFISAWTPTFLLVYYGRTWIKWTLLHTKELNTNWAIHNGHIKNVIEVSGEDRTLHTFDYCFCDLKLIVTRIL